MCSIIGQRRWLINHLVSLAHLAGSLFSRSLVNQVLNFEILPPPPPAPSHICRAVPSFRRGEEGCHWRHFLLPGHLSFCWLLLWPAAFPSASHGLGLASYICLDDLGEEVVGSGPQKGESTGNKGRGGMPAANVAVPGTSVLPRICSPGPALPARGSCVWKYKILI